MTSRAAIGAILMAPVALNGIRIGHHTTDLLILIYSLGLLFVIPNSYCSATDKN